MSPRKSEQSPKSVERRYVRLRWFRPILGRPVAWTRVLPWLNSSRSGSCRVQTHDADRAILVHIEHGLAAATDDFFADGNLQRHTAIDAMAVIGPRRRKLVDLPFPRHQSPPPTTHALDEPAHEREGKKNRD